MIFSKRLIGSLLPVIIIVVAVVISVILFVAKPEPETKAIAEVSRSIRVVTASKGSVLLSVQSQGTVEAKQVIELTPQVSGQIVYVSEKFVDGGIFKKGEVILRIDPRDYHYAVTSAQAQVAESHRLLEKERAEAALARTEWGLLGQGPASDLTLRIPQLADMEAQEKASEASLSRAELNLERTEIRAAFNGLISNKSGDMGQFLTIGMRVGRLYSTDVVEVRLPMSSRDLGQFDIKGLKAHTFLPNVTLSGRFADQDYLWKGKIVRSEGLIDTNTRIMYVVAQLRGDQLMSLNGNVPIRIGQFVSAKIEGRRYDGVFTLPHEALRQGDQVLVVDGGHKLRSRKVKLVDSNRDTIVVSEGLKVGDIVSLTQLGMGVDGLLVNYDLTSEGGL